MNLMAKIGTRYEVSLNDITGVQFGLSLDSVRYVTLTFKQRPPMIFDSLTHATEAEIIQAARACGLKI